MFFMWSGWPYHAVGPAIEKEQSPNFVQDRGTGSSYMLFVYKGSCGSLDLCCFGLKPSV